MGHFSQNFGKIREIRILYPTGLKDHPLKCIHADGGVFICDDCASLYGCQSMSKDNPGVDHTPERLMRIMERDYKARITQLEERNKELEKGLKLVVARWSWFFQPNGPEPPIVDMDELRKLVGL